MLSDLIFKNRDQWKLNDILEIVGIILVFVVILIAGVLVMTVL